GTAEVWWICEDHTAGRTDAGPAAEPNADAPHIERYIAAVPLDGSAADDPSAIRRITPASRFVAHPRISPDGTRIAWLSWEHPQMPWDGNQLQVATLTTDGAGEVTAGASEVVAGSTEISVLQPEWLDDRRLMFVTDESGWWNPAVWSTDGGTAPVLSTEEEFAGALWTLGTTWYQVLD